MLHYIGLVRKEPGSDFAIDGLDVNGWIVSVGWAVAYRKFSTAYVQREDQARAAGVGLWAGRFDMPWDWRATH